MSTATPAPPGPARSPGFPPFLRPCALAALGWAALFGALLSHPAWADLVHLKNGKVLRGEVVEERDGYIVVKLLHGQVKLRADRVDHIERQSAGTYRLDLGRDLLHQRRYRVAIEQLEEAYRTDKTSKTARVHLARAYLKYAGHLHKGRRLAEAKRHYRLVLGLDPESQAARDGLGRIEADTRRLQDLIHRAKVALVRSDLDGAIQEFEAALEFSPDARQSVASPLARCHAARGQSLYRVRQYEQATAALERAFSLDAALADPLERLYTASALSIILRDLAAGDVAKARAGLVHVQTFAPANTQVLYIAGRLESALKDLAAAGAYYAQALKIRVVRFTPDVVADLRARLEKRLKVPDQGARIEFNIEPADISAFAKAETDRFQVLETDHFQIHHFNSALAEEVGRVLEAHRRRILDLTRLNAAWSKKPRVYIYRTQEEYSRETKQESWSGGSSRYTHIPGRGLTKMQIHSWQTSPRLLKSVIPHEVMHLVVNSELKHASDLPRALHEGFSVLMEPQFRHRYYTRFLISRMTGKEFIPLDALLKMKDYPADPEFFYAEGFALVGYLVKKHGLQAALRLVRNAGEKGGVHAELLAVTGFTSIDRLQDDWKRWLEEGGL